MYIVIPKTATRKTKPGDILKNTKNEKEKKKDRKTQNTKNESRWNPKKKVE